MPNAEDEHAIKSVEARPSGRTGFYLCPASAAFTIAMVEQKQPDLKANDDRFVECDSCDPLDTDFRSET